MSNYLKDIRELFDTFEKRSCLKEGLITGIVVINIVYYLVCKAIGPQVMAIFPLFTDSNNQPYVSLIYILGYPVLSIIIFVIWRWYRKIPQIPRDKIGILFCTINSEEQEQNVKDLYGKIYSLLKEKDLLGLFSIKRLPKNIQILTHAEVTRIQKKAGSVLTIWGDFDKGESQGKAIYGFSKVNFSYSAPSNTSLEFHKEIASGIIGRKFVYDKQNDFFQKNILSKHLADCSLYIIGMCLIAGRHFQKAISVLGPLLGSLSTNESASREPVYIKNFRAKIKKNLAMAYAFAVEQEYSIAYNKQVVFETPKEQLKQWDNQLDQAISLDKRDSRYYLLKGIIQFLLKNISGSKHTISLAKKLAPKADSAPNFSMAFLHLFSGNYKRAKKEYSSALSKKSSHDTALLFNITGFMTQTIEKFPDKIQYHFALGLINAERLDSKIASIELKIFLVKSKDQSEYDFLIKDANKMLPLIKE